MDERQSVSPGPEGLRALAHPGRLRMLGLLRHEGPATATMLAARTGLNTGATSYHLRQLAKHGFVEEDTERGNGRDRWWRAAHQVTRTDTGALPPEEQDAADAYLQAVAITYADNLQRHLAEAHSLSPAWRTASTLSDWNPRLTPEHAAGLLEAIYAVIEEWPEDDDPDARVFTVNLNAYRRPGQADPDQTDPDQARNGEPGEEQVR